MQEQSLKNEYNAVNVCINPVQYIGQRDQPLLYERPAFASYLPLIDLKPYTCVLHDSDLAKE